MTPALTKLLIGAGATAAVGSGGYGIYYFATSPKTIRQKLLQENLTLLDLSIEGTNKNADEWTKKITEYKKSSTSHPRFTDLDLTTAPNEDTEKIKKLKKKCSSVLDTSLSASDANDLLPKVKVWCFKGTLESQN